MELQIAVNKGQNEILSVTGQQKDCALAELKNQIRDMGQRLGKVVEEASHLPPVVPTQMVSDADYLVSFNFCTL